MPSSNSWAEPLTFAINSQVADRVSHHFSRITVQRLALDDASEAHFQNAPMLEAARLLADTPLDVITWNGTAASWRGLENDLRLTEAITAETGIPATTSTLGFYNIFKRMGARRISLALPYTEDVAEAIRKEYARQGFEVVHSVSLGCVANRDIGNTTQDTMRKLLRESAHPDADCIAVVCTNFPATALVPEIEAETGLPVIDSIAVTHLDACLKAGVTPRITGWGRMFEEI